MKADGQGGRDEGKEGGQRFTVEPKRELELERLPY